MKYKINDFFVFTIFSLFIFNYKSLGQAPDSVKKPYEIGLEGQVGFVLKHTHKLAPIKTGTPYGWQLYYARIANGTKPWHQLFNYPTYGASLTYMSMGNKSVLGEAVVGLAYMQFKVISFRESDISWHFGTGLAYCNTVYDSEKNPLNYAISTSFSYSMQSQLMYNHELTEKLKFKIGAGITHISNGSIRKPNLGINIPTANIALFYNPIRGSKVYYKKLLEPYKKDWRLNIAYNISFSRLDSASKVLYPAHVLSVYTSKRVNRIHSFLFGVEGIYDNSLKAEMERQKSWGLNPAEEIGRVLLTVGHELTISRLALATQIGLYVYRPFKTKSWSYQRIQLKYYLNKNLFIGSALRTHFATADGIEVGLGIKI